MRDEGGQALVVAALVLGLAAVTVAGLRAAQDELLRAARDGRAGEAAVAAAGSAVADAHLEHVRRAFSEGSAYADPARFLMEPTVERAAREAAGEIALLNGSVGPSDLRITSQSGGFDVEIVLAGRRHRAHVAPPW